jgi:hypothetical protein
VSGMFVFFFVIISIYIVLGLYNRARRGQRRGGQSGATLVAAATTSELHRSR